MLDKLSAYVNLSNQKSKNSVKKNDPIHFNLPKYNGNFTGRNEDLRAILKCLDRESGFTVISGKAGVGKNYLVLQFLHQLEVEDWNILWLAAETEEDLQQSLRKAEDCFVNQQKGKKNINGV